MNFKDKVALITGGNRGIGASIAYIFAKNLCNIIITYCNHEEEAIKIKKELVEKYNVKIEIIKCNLDSEIEIKNMVDKVINIFGKIDILVNNVGIAIDTLFEDKTKENFMKTLEINLVGTFLVSKYVGEFMLKNKYGKIINISSTNGIDTYYPMSLDYDASKAGVINLTHNLAVYYAPYINVNCVAPGWVNTPMNKDLNKEFIENENKKILLKRFAQPEEIASVVLFLASDNAKYINSEVIRVDGGYYV